MKPIYEPKGKAKEYGDLALNIYTGCDHRCFYCFAPNVLRRDREQFHTHIEPRPGIVEETRKQLEREQITGKLVHLCFTCDPYPTGLDSIVTREIIKLLKEYGNHVQILTKGDGSRDFDLLDGDDWFGITYAGYDAKYVIDDIPCPEEPGAISPHVRIQNLYEAHERGIKTWISFEPVLNAVDVLNYLELNPSYVDRVKIGKLNYHPSDIDWADFGRRAERICQVNGMDYYIKDSLREEMEKKMITGRIDTKKCGTNLHSKRHRLLHQGQSSIGNGKRQTD